MIRLLNEAIRNTYGVLTFSQKYGYVLISTLSENMAEKILLRLDNMADYELNSNPNMRLMNLFIFADDLLKSAHIKPKDVSILTDEQAMKVIDSGSLDISGNTCNVINPYDQVEFDFLYYAPKSFRTRVKNRNNNN